MYLYDRAYLYKGELFSHSAIYIAIMRTMPRKFRAPSRTVFVNMEHFLDYVAANMGIDRQNEDSFSSDEFPKVVFDFDEDEIVYQF